MLTMSDRRYVYIDGESHFIRSENAWRQLHGEEACLGRLRYVNQADDRMILVLPEAKVFWTRRMNPDVHRATYFTSASGDEPARHQIMVTLREFGLEPSIVQERTGLRSQRQNVLNTQQLIEKPKGVDIALAVRMLEDAYHQTFDVCHLYTSDVDFLPVIQAIRARGKQVFVHGYRNGLSQHSPLLHVPDRFVDLEEMLRNECALVPVA
jgi:uncharacterized LabA/DUF88 family protein